MDAAVVSDNLISVKRLSATEASRNFADVLNSVERGGEPVLVVRRGRAVAKISPVHAESGKDLKDALSSHRPDRQWAGELRELRGSPEPVTDPWRD
ncbi:MAG TPA: type II toxin-antitoxin system Phd/YefM family antitoxin [Solirubrobacterales bacterium]|nr:type II toxin-antitoxin system Phd/YefM family antitoxin [Solirubrobacterales bacterium]